MKFTILRGVREYEWVRSFFVALPENVTTSRVRHGDLGVAVVVPAELRDEERLKMEKHRMNVVASDLTSLNRRLPDVRHERQEFYRVLGEKIGAMT